MKRMFVFLMTLVLWILPPTVWAQTTWSTVASGLEYTKLANFSKFPDGVIHVFRIDPQRYQFQSAFIQMPANTNIPALMNQRGAVIATNGGYFSPEIKPLGIRISQGQTFSKLRPITWWGVFYLRNSQPNIVAQRDFRPNNNIDFAIQAGPRLVVDGEIPQLAAGIADRTALGITRNGKVILLVTDNMLLSTTQLGEIMRASENQNGLNCNKALNLDGGHSSQLYTNLSKLNVQRYNVSQVADLVLVVPKTLLER